MVRRPRKKTKVMFQKTKRSKSLQKISLVYSLFLSFVELDRLVYVVLAIENDCSICPAGAFKLTPQHQVRRNEAFKGLSSDEYLDLANYLHFRNVQTAQYKEELDKPSAPFNPRFLEPITEDQPRGLWSIQANESNSKSIIRSLQWPGFGFFHKHSSKKFGYLYIGDGLKNDEL